MNQTLSGVNRGTGVSPRVAAEVRAWLARRRITAREAARRLDWSQPYLAHRLSARRPFTVEDLDQLARLLEIPPAAFLDFPEELMPNPKLGSSASGDISPEVLAPKHRFISGKDCGSWAGSSVLGGREPAAA